MSLLLGALLLGGCVRAPEYVVTSHGAVPVGEPSYRILRPEGEPSSLPPAIEARLVERLAAAGLRPATEGSTSDLLLFASFVQRSGRTGTFTRGAPVDTAAAPEWIDAPTDRFRRLTSMALRFVEPRTGAEVRSSRAVARHGRGTSDAMIARLVDAAVAGQDVGAAER